MNAVTVFIALSILMVAGKILRVQIPILQKLYLPSSIIGGLIGLVAVSSLGGRIPGEFIAGIRSMPGFLINVIFATLLIAKPPERKKDTFSGCVFPQLVLAQIVIWGQYVVGVGLAGLLLSPLFGVEQAFGNLLELGFEGGHGTVGGMAAAFKAHSWEDGIALGYTVATIGMIGGIVIGMGMVNWAYRRGYVKSVRPFSKRTIGERKGIHCKDSRPSAGMQTVFPDSVDSLAWHIAIIGLAVLIGFFILQGLKAAEIALFPGLSTRIFNGFPMFPLCMIGGVVLRKVAESVKVDLLVDEGQMRRISGAALDFLAVSAVATIQLDVVAANWKPLAIMVVSGFIWTAFSVIFISRRIFSSAWFERAIAEFGQATGVTATGLLLLRTVDPDTKTSAAQSFAGKQLVHEPVTNLWVATAFALVMTVGWKVVFVISSAMLAIWGFIAWRIARKLK